MIRLLTMNRNPLPVTWAEVLCWDHLDRYDIFQSGSDEDSNKARNRSLAMKRRTVSPFSNTTDRKIRIRVADTTLFSRLLLGNKCGRT